MSTRPKLKRDWVGRMVKLKREITTIGGIIFDAGETMKVSAYYRGLELQAIHKCESCCRRTLQIVTRVDIDDVELAEVSS